MALPNNPTQAQVVKAIKDIETNKLSDDAVVFVKGDTTGTSPIWTATSSEITSYKDGMMIMFQIGIAGLSGTNTTLNINNLGAKRVFENNNTNPSTHYVVGSVLFMVYDASADSNNGAWKIAGDRVGSDALTVRVYNYSASDYDRDLVARQDTAAITSGSYTGKYLSTTSHAKINTSTGKITSDSGFAVTNGTSSQFLKADGSTDSTSYQTALPTTTTAGKVLKSTSTAGTLEWGDAGATITSVNGLAGGQLTSALYLAGGDATSGVANIQLDTDGQITAKGTTQTLFGRSNSTTLLVGHSSHALTLRGSATRPTYNGNALALSSDVPTSYVSSVNGQTGAVTLKTPFYGTSSTQIGVAAKVVTCSEFTSSMLVAGTTIRVYFSYGNSASSPTLNVNSTGAKNIYRDAFSDQTATWNGGAIITFTYDGSYWIMNDASLPFTMRYTGSTTSTNASVPDLMPYAGNYILIPNYATDTGAMYLKDSSNTVLYRVNYPLVVRRHNTINTYFYAYMGNDTQKAVYNMAYVKCYQIL